MQVDQVETSCTWQCRRRPKLPFSYYRGPRCAQHRVLAEIFPYASQQMESSLVHGFVHETLFIPRSLSVASPGWPLQNGGNLPRWLVQDRGVQFPFSSWINIEKHGDGYWVANSVPVPRCRCTRFYGEATSPHETEASRRRSTVVTV